MKSRTPKTSTLALLLGVAFMDIMDGLFIVLGADRVTPDLASGPYLFFDLTFIDWDHSLCMGVLLSLLWGALFLRNPATSCLAALAVFSHFLADWPVHNHDLALYPYSEQHMGLGLWGSLGTGAWVLEGLFAALLVAFAWRRARLAHISLLRPALLLLVLFVVMSPWLSPMLVIARLPEPWAHLAHGTTVALGFLVPGFILVRMIDRDQARASA